MQLASCPSLLRTVPFFLDLLRELLHDICRELVLRIRRHIARRFGTVLVGDAGCRIHRRRPVRRCRQRRYRHALHDIEVMRRDLRAVVVGRARVVMIMMIVSSVRGQYRVCRS